MDFYILSDKDEKYDGKFTAIFQEDDETYRLIYDLEEWKNINESGLYGANFLKIVLDDPATIYFDQKYELDKEECRKLYKVLYNFGWKKN